jgi:phage terminase small subunit
MVNITPKQEKFCMAYIETGNASEAYRKAGYSKGMSDKTVNEASARLLKNSKVVARLAEIRKPALEAAQITLADHLKDLKRLRDLSESEGKFSAAVSAEIARGKVSGLYIEKVEITGELSLAEAITKAKARVQ